jgi:glycosyltransferase involved in cell wall biosynthesis
MNKDDDIKISIVTVVKNGMPFVVDTIQSVLSQNYKFIEYIFIDSASIDGTTEYALNYKDKIAKIVSEKDAGISDAFNKGISLASGDYIMFLNADDKLYNQDSISCLVAYAKDRCYPTFLYGDCEVLQRSTGLRKYIASIDYRRVSILKGIMPPHPSMIAHKSYFDRFGRFDLDYKIAMDFEWFIRGLNTSNIVHVPVIITSVRDGGVSTKNQKKAILEIISALKKNNYLSSNHKIIFLWTYFLASYMVRIILTKLHIYKFIKKSN